MCSRNLKAFIVHKSGLWPCIIEISLRIQNAKSPLENQKFQRNPNIVQQQSSPNAPIQPKPPVQQSPALDTPAIEVIAVSDVYVDGFTVAHGGIVICKKTLETCSDDDCGKTFESFSFSSPDDDGTSGLSFQPEEVMKIFM